MREVIDPLGRIAGKLKVVARLLAQLSPFGMIGQHIRRSAAKELTQYRRPRGGRRVSPQSTVWCGSCKRCRPNHCISGSQTLPLETLGRGQADRHGDREDVLRPLGGPA